MLVIIFLVIYTWKLVLDLLTNTLNFHVGYFDEN